MWKLEILRCCFRKGKEALQGKVKEGKRLDLPFYAIFANWLRVSRDKDKENDNDNAN